MEEFDKTNKMILKNFSIYLNDYSSYITKEMIDNVKGDYLSDEDAFKIIIGTIFNVIDDKFIMNEYINCCLKKLDIDKYTNDLYYKNIKLSNIKGKFWQIEMKKYDPYEAFVFNDLKSFSNGKIIPQIGFFDDTYYYPCVMQNGRCWMLITPNEIETMKKPINEAFGDVITYGLGLGYFTYMISLKENVDKITVVENDEEVIELFKTYILPQFPNKEKINIICDDAYNYASKKIKCDYCFIDIYHDPSDGVEAYLKFKKLERPDVIYSYWIYDTIKCYLK